MAGAMNFCTTRGIRETMIGRAREASSAALSGDSIAKPLQLGENAQNSKEKGIALAMQTLISAGVIEKRATARI
jgi:hypothetical protein